VLGIGRAEPASVLTAREAEVLALVEQGRTNKEIAATLVISAKTVSVHISNILTKLGAANRTEAVTLARRDALLTFEPSTRARHLPGPSTPGPGPPPER
jgi:DNA-binding NarL/FixJ family response regulator